MLWEMPSSFRSATRAERSELAAHQAAYRWFRTSTPLDATSYAYDDPLFYLYTGRRGLGLTMPYGRIYHSDPEREANEFTLAVPQRTPMTPS